MEALVLAIVAVLAIAVTTAVAPRVKVAGPLLLVAIGIGVSLLPFVPGVDINPDIILVGILPPLLYSAAVQLPAIEFRRDFGAVAGLSVLLVLVSSIALALFFNAVVPGLGLFLALALGAILSPTDAVATAIVRRLGISRRVVTLLEGESLLNDATSLVILRVAVAIAVTGSVPEGGILGAFVWGVVIAVVIGAIVGWINLRVRHLIHNSAANTAIGIVVPFIAYLPTEQLEGSGLVAAVVAGIVTGQGSARWFTPEQRMSDALNWRTIELVLEGGVFLIMGLELKELLEQNLADDQGIGHAAWLALSAFAIIMVVRAGYVSLLVWLQSRRARRKLANRDRVEAFNDRLDALAAHPEDPPVPEGRPGEAARGWWLRAAPEQRDRRVAAGRARVGRLLADLDYYQASPLGWKHGTVIVWAGMRGVVTLAAAQTLPRETADRPLLVFVAFLVAVGSLMFQGLTLPWVVRMLRIDDSAADTVSRAEQVRLDDELRQAAASALSDPELAKRDGSEFPAELVDRVGSRLIEPPDDDESAAMQEVLELRLAMIEVMRRRLTELSSGGLYSTAVLRHALAELDADQLSLELRLDDVD
ncbi:sodium:proton antiporter [Microbacterium sp. 4R-513]|uniref:cation:proton antiporter n=1 Tax=Microbacterium sp. 4R-513 TaxID=2567934 RepID=UPI0013E1ED6E|nr:sodium:proton antiporter [Microbacterium sp. 4R-513]QIG38819.1 sodium:proton antiporter [Microbacterium sp. 4R-513]